MLSEFLKDYLPIILFLIIALGLSCAFVVVNFILSPKNQILKNYLLMNVDLNHLKTLEWNLMLGFI
jgi:NADH:ubiquinone oxidoreductase subunit 3 (subunit A)